MAAWVPGVRGRPPKRVLNPATGRMNKNRYVRRHQYHQNKVGDLSRLFDAYMNDDIDYWDTGSEWNRHRRMRAILLAGITEQVWWAKENVANAIAEGFAPAVIEPIVQQAKQNMHDDYVKAMGEEPLNKKNPWEQGDPSESDAFKVGKISVNGSEEEIWWHGGVPKALGGTGRGKVYGGNKFQTFAMRRIRYRFSAIDQDQLDKTLDRPMNQSIPVRVAIPYYQRSAGETNAANMFMRSFLAVAGEDTMADDKYVKIIELDIRGRTERRRDRRTGRPWTLWRALEYGQTAGRYKRIMVKNVKSFKEVPEQEKSDSLRSNTKVAYASSLVTEDEWTVFMSPKWQWWARQGMPINGDQLVKVDVSNNYTAGTAPIRRALSEAENDGQMKRLIARALDDAMVNAGFRRG